MTGAMTPRLSPNRPFPAIGMTANIIMNQAARPKKMPFEISLFSGIAVLKVENRPPQTIVPRPK